MSLLSRINPRVLEQIYSSKTRVKTICGYILISIRQIGCEPINWNPTNPIVTQFCQQYLVVYSIKCFLQVHKNSTTYISTIKSFSYILNYINQGMRCRILLLYFPINSKQDASFHRIAFSYSCADWDDFCDHLRDVPWEDIFKHSASAAVSEFCEWVQVRIDVYIPHC